MKKFIVVLVALVLAAPAMAAVNITCTADPLGVVTVSFNATTEPNLVRAFALEITVDSGAVITSVTSLQGPCPAGYWVHPGSVEPLAVPPVWGTCVAEGLGTATVIIEMGSLYHKGVELPPPNLDDLLTFTVDKDCTVTIAENAIRGGVVMENPAEAPVVNLSGCIVTIAPPVCVGDVDGNSFINKADIIALVNYLVNNATAPFWSVPSTSPAYSAAADIDSNNFVNKADIIALVNYLVNNASAPFWTVPCP